MASPRVRAADVDNVLSAAICVSMCGCSISAVMPAMTDDVNSTISDGTLRAMSTAVRSGTISVHNDMLNVCDNPSVYWLISSSVSFALPSPVTKNMSSVMMNVGVVVSVM